MRLATFAAVISLAAPAAAQDRATIEKLNDAFEATFNKGDFAALGTMDTCLPPAARKRDGERSEQRPGILDQSWRGGQ